MLARRATFYLHKENEKQSEREFRELIWKMPGRKSDDVELLVPVMVKEDRTAQIQISSELISRSYLVIDFANPVFDGGYYYTIDIPEFYRDLKDQN